MTIDDPLLKAHHDGLAFYESQLLSLYREKDKYHPTQYFAVMADPLVDHIRRTRAEIDEYIGLADFERATAAYDAVNRKSVGNPTDTQSPATNGEQSAPAPRVSQG